MTEQGKRSVLTTGYVALDVIQAPEGTWLRAGGTAANVAAILAYLGWRSSIVGLLGDDDAGPIVEHDLRIAGVDTSSLHLRSNVGTPLVLHQIASSGHRFRFGCAVCGRPYRRHRPISRADLRPLLAADAPADAFFFDRPTSPALEVAAAYRTAGRLVVYEPASAGRPLAHRRAVELADIVKFSEERLPLFADALQNPQPGQLWISTAGAAGTRFRLGRGRWRKVAAVAVDATDAGGAGDWMTAALMTNLGSPIDWTIDQIGRTVHYSQAIAALSCLVPGARTLADVLSPSELGYEARRLVAGQKPRLVFRFAADSAPDDRCRHCRLPIMEATTQAS